MRALFALLLVSVVACGGPKDEPPTPLAKHFDDMYIAQVPLDQKQDVVKTQNDWSIAKMENAKAEADFNDAATTMQIVRNDAKTAHTGVDSAMAMKKSAQTSGDMNRINQATKDERIAEDLAKAADERVKYFDVYRQYLNTLHRYTLETMYWREAQYEVAKAVVAQKSGKAIQNIKYEWFPSQEQDRGKRSAKWKERVEEAKRHALDARGHWLEVQKTADTENGHPASYSTPDPLAQPTAPATGESAPPVAQPPPPPTP